MNIFVATLVLFVVLWGVLWVNEYKESWDHCGSATLSFLMSASVSSVIFLIVIVAGSFSLKLETSHYFYEIVSLKDNGGIQGAYQRNFLYGVGYINSTENYVVMKRRSGGYEREIIPSQGVLVVEDDSVPPQVMMEQTCYTDRFLERFFLKANRCPEQKAIRLFVPKNTVVQQFKIN